MLGRCKVLSSVVLLLLVVVVGGHDGERERGGGVCHRGVTVWRQQLQCAYLIGTCMLGGRCECRWAVVAHASVACVWVCGWSGARRGGGVQGAAVLASVHLL
jgi:hypothetical protein